MHILNPSTTKYAFYDVLIIGKFMMSEKYHILSLSETRLWYTISASPRKPMTYNLTNDYASKKFDS